MSDAYYATRLRFEGWSGAAKLHGQRVPLRSMPRLPGIDLLFVAVDYIPEVKMKRIMPLGGPWRDMEDHEVAAADVLLREIVASAFGELT